MFGERKGFFGRMSERINDALMMNPTIDEDFFDELEEILITSDIGMETTVKISVGELTLSSVVFGSVDYAVDSPVKFDVVGEKIVLFDSETHDRIAIGSLKI